MTRLTFGLLAGAIFAVAPGYGAVLPLLPTMLGEPTSGAGGAVLARHTGALLGSYMLGPFVTAPLWGRLADRVGGRPVLLFGLCGYAAALVALAPAGSPTSAYGWRLLAAVAAGLVGGAAWIGTGPRAGAARLSRQAEPGKTTTGDL